MVMAAIALVGATPSAAIERVKLPEGAASLAHVSAYVQAAGDVNGDGIPDLVAGDFGARNWAGSSYVIFGPIEEGEKIDPQALGDRGFRIDGAEPEEGSYSGDRAGFAFAAGDVNGDGLEDVAIGSPNKGQHPERSSSGSVYVVFGKSSADPVSLAMFDVNAQGPTGFRIDGPTWRARIGEDVAAAGDIDGDGLDDLIVGSPFRGASYVVFGKQTPEPVDLLTFDLDAQGPLGFRIETGTVSRNDLYEVAGGGDINGDGVSDLVIGVIRNTYGRGAAYVIFGKGGSDPVDVKQLGDKGFWIKGKRRGAHTGYSIDIAGDVNGDGLADVIVGAPASYVSRRGHAFVVFGKRDSRTVRLRGLGSGGFKLEGGTTHPIGQDCTACSVAGGGDVNGDGRADLVVGARYASYRGKRASGAVYVIFGKKSALKVDLFDLGDRGFKIIGPYMDAYVGYRVGKPSDVGGDSRADILTGSLEGGYIVITGAR